MIDSAGRNPRHFSVVGTTLALALLGVFAGPAEHVCAQAGAVSSVTRDGNQLTITAGPDKLLVRVCTPGMADRQWSISTHASATMCSRYLRAQRMEHCSAVMQLSLMKAGRFSLSSTVQTRHDGSSHPGLLPSTRADRRKRQLQTPPFVRKRRMQLAR